MHIRSLCAVVGAVVCAVFLVSLLPSLARADQLADMQQRVSLRVAVPQDYPPFGFVGPDMKMPGYDVEMAQYISRSPGVKCELMPATGANRMPFMQNGRADVIISTHGKTPGRPSASPSSAART